MRGINSNLPDQYTTMVSYHQLVGSQDSLTRVPHFYPTIKTSQLVWHELGHTYLAAVFARHQPEVNQVAYLVQQDPNAAHWAALQGGWSKFLNENVTQAITNVLKLRTGKITRADAFAPNDFFIYAPELGELIAQQYTKDAPYRNFEEYFPVLMREFAKKHPVTTAK
jgi:hypothetical protein